MKRILIGSTVVLALILAASYLIWALPAQESVTRYTDASVSVPVLGNNADLILWIISGLLTVIAAFILLTYRGVLSQMAQTNERLAGLEEQHRLLCRVLVTSTVALHPSEAAHVLELMKDVWPANG